MAIEKLRKKETKTVKLKDSQSESKKLNHLRKSNASLNAFAKLNHLRKLKSSSLVLGLDASPIEFENEIKRLGSEEKYLRYLLQQTEPFIIGVKINLAFYEGDEDRRKLAMKIMKEAGEMGLIKILDVKRGDILATQTQYAAADIKNFEPDIVTLNAYMGGMDVVKPYLDLDKNLCVYILTSTSNSGAKEIQNIETNAGLQHYAYIADCAHKWDKNRIGFVTGATKIEEIKKIRRLEKENDFEFAEVLAPGFGKQGADLEFVKFAKENVIYPISSGLTKDKYLNGLTPSEAAKKWRDDINANLAKAEKDESIKSFVKKALIEEGIIKIAKSNDLIKDGFFLKKGKTKLTKLNIELPKNADERYEKLNQLIKNKTLSNDDFSDIFINLRDIMGLENINARNELIFLYTKLVKDSEVNAEVVAGVPYGALFPGMLTANNLGLPFVTQRKEQDLTHSSLIGFSENLKGKKVIIIEDVVTSGGSSINFANDLRKAGLMVNDVVAFLDRCEGGEKNLKQNGLTLHSVFKMQEIKSKL
jgi:orotidine 5'-phosphate decarboxylase subfamily 2